MQEVILYGSGRRCKRIAMLLHQGNVHIKCIVDTNPEKWGTQVSGVTVNSPKVICELTTVPLCITIEDKETQMLVRRKVAEEYGYDLSKEISYFELMVLSYQNMSEIQSKIEEVKRNRKSNIIFDCHSGLGLGGIEAWTKDICTELIKNDWNNLHILTDMGVYNVPAILGSCIDAIRINSSQYFENETVFNVLEYLINCAPAIVITSKPSVVLFAACILKRLLPEKIQIISVIHGGHELIYSQYDQYRKDIDVYVGVSEDIKAALIMRGIEKGKVYSITCPVRCEQSLKRMYTEDATKPIKIGYAGRLEVEQKRMDLLLELIELLEKKQVNYSFDIAGDGHYRETMEKMVSEKHLEQRVNFLGTIRREEIPSFWKKQDIYVNIADFEGRSITQLEAMVNGAVPIVTETSGTREDITEGLSGYIVELGNYRTMADKIEYLSENREKLRIMGQSAHDSVCPKCQREIHTQFWEEVLRKQEWMLLSEQ